MKTLIQFTVFTHNIHYFTTYSQYYMTQVFYFFTLFIFICFFTTITIFCKLHGLQKTDTTHTSQFSRLFIYSNASSPTHNADALNPSHYAHYSTFFDLLLHTILLTLPLLQTFFPERFLLFTDFLFFLLLVLFFFALRLFLLNIFFPPVMSYLFNTVPIKAII